MEFKTLYHIFSNMVFETLNKFQIISFRIFKKPYFFIFRRREASIYVPMSVGRSVGWSVGWLVGRSVGWSSKNFEK